jgi:amidase
MSVSELCFHSAVELARLIRERRTSCMEVMLAHLEQIERVNPQVNAIVTLLPEAALHAAARADEQLAEGVAPGPLFGLPIAHKDLVSTKGIRTTFGSPIFKDHVPEFDDLIVERLRNAGAICIGKTNTPEFGAGSQTFNEVFGVTRNPYDLTKTCGGSSGGAAVALACGMLPIADGSDTGGSLRNPAAFCNVVGFRTSPGRVPVWPTETAWFPISVQGPMARTVADAALMLAATAGPDDRSPISISEPGEQFLAPLDRNFRGVKIAWSRDFGGLPIDPRILETMDGCRGAFESLGCVVEDGEPDFRGADESFRVWRAWKFELKFAELRKSHPEQIKDAIHWNAEEGEKLTGPQISRAERARTELYHRVREFLVDYEYMVFPVTQVPPFDVNQPFVDEIAGQKLETYIDWMKSCYYVTVTGLPAISVPAGFTSDGLPVGLQIVGRHQQDFAVLQLAHAFEQATQHGRTRPALSGEG